LLDRQRRSFDGLVETGIYDLAFDHPAVAKAFVSQVLSRVVPRLSRRGRLSILDCGCGTGAWLTYLHRQLVAAGLTSPRLCGFDLSERMVEVARTKLHGLAEASDIRCGNVLDRESYAFDGMDGGFDLVFTYDVVQQLPRAHQMESCRVVLDSVAGGGVALIFDNDAESPFGRRMALRKFLTRYCGLQLVPDYYCNASYPRLERLRQKLQREGGVSTEVVVRDDALKRGLIAMREASTRATAISAP
jgi:SAM-dependent methyltransferase